MSANTLPKPADHSMAHHLVTYAANNMIAPLVHAQIARDEYETLSESVLTIRAQLEEAEQWLSQTKPAFHNGAGCMAATVVEKLKEAHGIGGIYLYPQGSSDCGEEYVYTVYVKDGAPWVRVTDTDKTLYDGTVDAFDGEAVEAKAGV